MRLPSGSSDHVRCPSCAVDRPTLGYWLLANGDQCVLLLTCGHKAHVGEGGVTACDCRGVG